MRMNRIARIARPRFARYGRAACVALAIAIAGCASVGDPSAGRRSYVGVFTGDFVDGLPLYRLPSITVVGTRDGPAAD